MLTKSAQYAYEKGYRIKDNSVVSPLGRILKLQTQNREKNYPQFSIRVNGKVCNVKAHTLAAWQKYGRDCIGKHVYVRHKDDDSTNFRLENILLGTPSENQFDRYRNFKGRHYANCDIYTLAEPEEN